MKKIERYCGQQIHQMIHLLVFFLIIVSSNAQAVRREAASTDKLAVIEINTNLLQKKIEALNARKDLNEATKTKILSLYQTAQDNLSNSEKFNAQAAEFKKAVKNAPIETKKLLKEIEAEQQKQTKRKLEEFNNIPTGELEQRLIIEKGKLTNLDEQFEKKETELTLNNNRPQLIREETVAAKQEIDEAQKAIEEMDLTPALKLEKEAKLLQLKTLIDSKMAELKRLDAEAISNPARVELLKTELQFYEVQKNEVSLIVTAIENLLSERRQQEAKKMENALSQAEKELSGKPAIIQKITRQNIQYSRDLQDVTEKIEKYNELKNQLDAKTLEISNDFKSAEKKIDLAGLSPALGRILREQRRNLEKQDRFTEQTEKVPEETAAASLDQLEDEDKLKKFIDIDSFLKETMQQDVDQTLPVDKRMMIQAELRMLLNSQKDLLTKLSAAYTTFLRTLGDFDFARQQMIVQADKYAAYLDERLLWVPSSEPINKSFLPGLYHAVKWLLMPKHWKNVIKDVLDTGWKHFFLTVIAFLCLFAMYFYRGWFREHLKTISGKVERIFTDNFNYTLKALAYTVLLVLPLPFLIYFLGRFLTGDVHVTDFSRAVGEGLKAASIPLLMLQFFYRLFAPNGIAVQHFQWQKNNAALLRQQFAWIRFIAVPAIFLIYCTGASKVSIYGDSLGRLSLIVIMITISQFFGWVLQPETGLLSNHMRAHPNGWVKRLRYVWYPAGIGIPLIIMGFAVAGYYLSALELQQQLIESLRLIFFLIIIHESVFRWLTLVNRQLAIKNARQKRKSATQLTEKTTEEGGEEPMLPVDEQLIDIPKINAQTRNLLNVFIGFSVIVGIGVIWKNILPAFSFLEDMVLWKHLVKVDNQEIMQPITLANLFLAGLYGFITVVSVRNLFGVMELLLFRRLSIEPGVRYAITQLTKYFLIAVGFLCVANELGGSWSEVQWLVAALGVGLGFGLQEIFANMVSGIILLFERPIRIGDTVTIGDVTGKVCRIQIRATTLMDWDQKELIVPNKTFITNQLVNWSLTDAVTRVVVPVGIAYGSDVELAHQVMMDTVKSTPMVLADPPPSVLFMGFGDSSLDFSIRIFVSELANRLPVIHSLHVGMEKALRENNISIPFPQRDVHVYPVSAEASLKTPKENKNSAEVFQTKGKAV